MNLETNQKSVFGAIKVLGSRLSLLEPSHLDHVEGRLAALHQKLNVIAEKKQVCLCLKGGTKFDLGVSYITKNLAIVKYPSLTETANIYLTALILTSLVLLQFIPP